MPALLSAVLRDHHRRCRYSCRCCFRSRRRRCRRPRRRPPGEPLERLHRQPFGRPSDGVSAPFLLVRAAPASKHPERRTGDVTAAAVTAAAAWLSLSLSLSPLLSPPPPPPPLRAVPPGAATTMLLVLLLRSSFAVRRPGGNLFRERQEGLHRRPAGGTEMPNGRVQRRPVLGQQHEQSAPHAVVQNRRRVR